MSQFNLKVSELYDLIIGETYKLFIDGVASPGALAKRWDGGKWVLVYDWGRQKKAYYFDGATWVSISLR